jgi:hypothetical protein
VLGLIGAHRTGKSTLARALSEHLDYELVLTNAAQVFKNLAASPRIEHGVDEHLMIHEKLLEQLSKDYLSAQSGKPFVADRSPLDVVMYLIGDIHRGITFTPAQQNRFDRIVRRAQDLCRFHFSALIRVQPGIPIIDDPTKAPPNKAYIEHLNLVAWGLINDPDLPCVAMSLPRDVVELSARVKGCVFGLSRVSRDFVPADCKVS